MSAPEVRGYEAGEAPVFVIGPQRSGTTLLRLILDSHPDLASGPETGFMRAVRMIKNVPDFHGGDRWYEAYGFSEEDFDRHIARFYSGVFSDYAARQGKKRWVEKTPFHRYFVPEIARLFPDGKFVGMTRHPGAVAVSRKKWGYDIAPVLEDWSTSMRRMINDYRALGPDRFAFVRYEDLVTNPRGVLAAILEFIDVPWSGNVMSHQKVHAARGASGVTTGGTRTTDAIDPRRVDEWLTDLSPEEKYLIQSIEPDELAAFGYYPLTASTRRPTQIPSLGC